MSEGKSTRAYPASDEEVRPQFDSAFFVAFRLTHEALKGALADVSSLNVTQYRVLVKLATAGPAGIGQGNLGVLLRLKPNVTTQALNALSSQGLAERSLGSADRRSRTVRVTEEGLAHVAKVNERIVALLYDLFPTDNPSWRAILEASVAAGAEIDPPLSKEVSERYPASRALVSIEVVRLAIEQGLKRTCGVPLSEALVMLRLAEAQDPQRIVDIAEALDMSTANVTRTVDRLIKRGWVTRMGSSEDRKAVYAVMTPEGTLQSAVIGQTTNDIAADLLWSRLSDEGRSAIEKVGSVVIDGLCERRLAVRRVRYDDLLPLEEPRRTS